jgi:hypothetical protein
LRCVRSEVTAQIIDVLPTSMDTCSQWNISAGDVQVR